MGFGSGDSLSDAPINWVNLYSQVHTGNEGDIDFYVDACVGAEWVLELGCGSGRVGLPVSQVVENFVGLDIDWNSAFIASTKGLLCYAADMRDFHLNCQFDRIIVPCNTIYCMLSERDVVSCLKSIKKHLKSTGQIIFDGYVSYESEKISVTRSARVQKDWLKKIKYDGKAWDVYESAETMQAEGRIDVFYSHECRDSEETIETKIPQRYFSHHEIPELLGLAGLEMISMQGGFKNEPVSDDCESVVIRGTHGR